MHSNAPYSDQELLKGLQQGNRMAFTEIYKRYWKKVYVVAYNRMKDSAQAEDIAQEVFASLWSNKQHVKIEMLENYLATAAKYLVLTAIRKKELSRRFDKFQRAQMEICFRNPEKTFQDKQILELLELEIEKLPEKCKLIFRCSRNEGMAVKQIAERLSIAPKTVENQIHKALKLLKLASRTFIHMAVMFINVLF